MKGNFLLLDFAISSLDQNIIEKYNGEYLCLFREGIGNYLQDVSPYIFALIDNSKLKELFFLSGWGKSWGLLINSSVFIKDIYKHLRKHLLVTTENNEELYFRFYDPRVLRIFLPTCDKHQLEEFFGPVEYFICEDEDPAYGLIFSLNSNNELQTERKTKEEIFSIDNHTQQKRKFIV